MKCPDRLLAGGLYQKIVQPVFRFLVNFIADLLGLIEPVNKMLQAREISYSASVPLIDGCIEKIKSMRNDDEFLKYAEAGENLIQNENEDGEEILAIPVRRVLFQISYYKFSNVLIIFNFYRILFSQLVNFHKVPHFPKASLLQLLGKVVVK